MENNITQERNDNTRLLMQQTLNELNVEAMKLDARKGMLAMANNPKVMNQIFQELDKEKPDGWGFNEWNEKLADKGVDLISSEDKKWIMDMNTTFLQMHANVIQGKETSIMAMVKDLKNPDKNFNSYRKAMNVKLEDPEWVVRDYASAFYDKVNRYSNPVNQLVDVANSMARGMGYAQEDLFQKFPEAERPVEAPIPLPGERTNFNYFAPGGSGILGVGWDLFKYTPPVLTGAEMGIRRVGHRILPQAEAVEELLSKGEQKLKGSKLSPYGY